MKRKTKQEKFYELRAIIIDIIHKETKNLWVKFGEESLSSELLYPASVLKKLGGKPVCSIKLQKLIEMILEHLNLEVVVVEKSVGLKKKAKPKPIFTGYSEKQVKEKISKAIEEVEKEFHIG